MDEKVINGHNEKIDFETFIYSLGTSALVSLGAIDNPLDEKVEVNLESARQNIEVIELIQEKTRGNLTESEKKVLNAILGEIKAKFVEALKKNVIKI
jgi:hypothetical protein